MYISKYVCIYTERKRDKENKRGERERKKGEKVELL